MNKIDTTYFKFKIPTKRNLRLISSSEDGIFSK